MIKLATIVAIFRVFEICAFVDLLFFQKIFELQQQCFFGCGLITTKFFSLCLL